jgi:hypothetical protein
MMQNDKPAESFIEEFQSVYEAFEKVTIIEGTEHLWVIGHELKLVGVLSLSNILSCLF